MIRGSIVALVTPMREDGAVDFDSLSALVDWHVQQGTDALVAVGTTGETATLDTDEHIAVVKHVIRCAGGRIPVVAGTGANATREAIELTAEAKAIGADACLLVTPYYNKPPQEGLYRHYRAVAEAVDIPIVLYNVPGRTGCDMLPATVARLAQIPNVVGLKEAKGDLARISELLSLRPEGFAIYSGDDATACASILMGCDGDISVTGNVAPNLMHRMCAAALEGDREQAVALDRKLLPLHQKLFVEPNPIPTKWALMQLGRIPGGIRLPLVPMDPAFHQTVRDAMRAAGVIE